jgi:glutaredoxin
VAEAKERAVTNPAARTVTLYTSPGCHLCEEAERTLREVLAETGMLAETGRAEGPCRPASVELSVRDITTDESLHRAYFERIPVIALNGEELFEFHVDAEALRARLALDGPAAHL